MAQRFRLIPLTLIGLMAGAVIFAGDAAAKGLWVANSSTLAEFQGSLKSGPTTAHRVNSSADLNGSSTIAFDRKGNLWVTNFNTNQIVEFEKSQIRALKTNATPTASVTIAEDAGSVLNGPEGLVFDKSHNMWVGAERGQAILMYAPAQYAASGNPTADVILQASSFSFSSPSHVAFDKAGNLWVVDEDIPNANGGSGEVFEYTKSQITGLTAGTNFIDPASGIASAWFVHLETLAFDAKGNMWLADEDGVNVYKFTTLQLKGTGLSQNLTPDVVLSPTSVSGPCPQSLDGPYGIALDSSGNLFVTNANLTSGCFGSLAEFTAKSIKSSGNPTPKVFITQDALGDNIGDPNSLTFGPTVP